MIAPRDEVARTPRAEHGGRRALGMHDGAESVVKHDFSVSLNAFGPADVVTRAIAEALAIGSLDEYPDPLSRAPRAAAAALWQCAEEQIVFGAGAVELIQAVCLAYVRPGDPVLVATPAFSEYARAAAVCGGQTLHVALNGTPRNGESFCKAIESVAPRLVFVASPVNPTGEVIPLESIQKIAAACKAADSLLVLDQAYDAFADTPFDGPALADHPNVVHLRSLTKEHAVAGVRAGFAIAAAPVADAIERVRVPWAASTISQAAAVAALTGAAAEYVARTTAILRSERARISRACAVASIGVHPSSTHYFLIRVGDAAATRLRLLCNNHVLVRDCASFGLPGWIRVAARQPFENDLLIAALTADVDLPRLS